MTKIFILFATLVTGVSAQSYSTGPTYSSGPTYRGSATALTISIIQSKAAPSVASGTSFPVTLASAPTNGNRLVIIAQTNTSNSSVFSSISQTGVTWSAVSCRNQLSSRVTEIWLSGTASSASATITGTLFSAATSNLSQGMQVFEVNGISALDVCANTASATSATINSSITTATANTVIFSVARAGAGTSGTNYSPANGFTGYTPDAGDIRGVYASKILTSTATTDPAWTQASSALYNATSASFK